jgi:hypothetical protein
MLTGTKQRESPGEADMSHISPATLEPPEVVSVSLEAAPTRRTPTPVLITEREVAFSAAAAASTAPNHRRWLDSTGLAGVGRMLSALTQPRQHCPRRERDYFEAARMSRAMDRL